MKDVPYGDEEWQAFIEQLSVQPGGTIAADNRGNVAFPEVGKPANATTNGPCGIQGSYVKGSGKAAHSMWTSPFRRQPLIWSWPLNGEPSWRKRQCTPM